MKRQEILDMNPTNGFDWATQQFMISTSKTKLEQYKRTLAEMRKICYKTWALNLSLEELHSVVNTALMHNAEEDGKNNMENQNH